ncbi:hypothetical protein AURANDRAFT_64823 [Aureococcus anophagefferens]|uniref:Uncharacterized protein n=1 Tax=Aureococcus anophagefferens TaxID=44056 RepID=F0YBV6_AURAN|nr:hypothetical protein AURANDRAFT_64823 [Aureococcus anophagefferens]EGB07192.1 hypothetical protein AURANDRAFT_64823 [Aureococcus anophagefferens]|eukprot:XP_009037829.1 hypothetical protein AURANDRAFT_64823 [Aureococcus anophagefferens]
MLRFGGSRVAPLEDKIRVVDPLQPLVRGNTHNITIHYPLWLLTVNAGRYCLGSIPCHNLITLKWVAAQTVDGEPGWERLRGETRCGPYVVGWVWIGWHGFGRHHFYDYILRRIDEGRAHGGPSFEIEDEYDKNLITLRQVELGYYMHLALVPEYTRLFNCRNRGKSAEHNLSGDAQRALLVGRTALMCSDDFIKHCLLIKVLQPHATMADTLDYPHLFVCPLGRDAKGGPQFEGLLFFLPRAVDDLGFHDGVNICGLVAAGAMELKFPFPRVNLFDFAKMIPLVIKMPAYSESNCKAAGVLSGVAELAGSLARYGESDLKVTSEPGKFTVELRGFRIAEGESSVSKINLDFPSPAVDNDLFKTAVDRQLIFGHAGGASPDDREKWQEGKIKEVLEQIPPTADAMQPLVDGLFANRVSCRDVATGAWLEEDEEPPANFDYARYTDGALLPWDKRHENFAETAEALRVTYKTKIHRVSQPHLPSGNSILLAAPRN